MIHGTDRALSNMASPQREQEDRHCLPLTTGHSPPGLADRANHSDPDLAYLQLVSGSSTGPPPMRSGGNRRVIADR
jgi:hypothetical protein